MSALPLPEKISQNSSRTINQNTITVRFRDGAEQRAVWGINDMTDEWSIVYDNISLVDRNTVISFIETVGYVQAFTWTPPNESTARSFVIDSAPNESNVGYTVSFRIREVYA